jgi:hypothetical protein
MATSELSTKTGYSADVRLHLAISGRVIDLAQVAPEFLIINRPLDLPPCQGEVVVTVDGVESRRRASLMDGISKSSKFGRIAEL